MPLRVARRRQNIFFREPINFAPPPRRQLLAPKRVDHNTAHHNKILAYFLFAICAAVAILALLLSDSSRVSGSRSFCIYSDGGRLDMIIDRRLRRRGRRRGRNPSSQSPIYLRKDHRGCRMLVRVTSRRFPNVLGDDEMNPLCHTVTLSPVPHFSPLGCSPSLSHLSR